MGYLLAPVNGTRPSGRCLSPPVTLGAMRRRGVTVLVGAVLLVLLLWQIGNVPVPYVQFQPGPTYDTLGNGVDGKPIIVVEGTETSESAGELRLTTIEVVPKLTIGQA